MSNNQKEINLDELKRLAALYGKDIPKIARILGVGKTTLLRRVHDRVSVKKAFQSGLAEFRENN